MGRYPGGSRHGERGYLLLHERRPAGGEVQPGHGTLAGAGVLPAGERGGQQPAVVVFAGPVFSETDPVYRGVDIPLRFFKVAAFLHHGELAATGYVVDQTPQLDDLPGIPRQGVTDDAPPLGPYRTFQVPIRDIAALTGLDLDQLVAVDRMPIAAALPRARVTSTWRELHSPEDLDLDFDLGE